MKAKTLLIAAIAVFSIIATASIANAQEPVGCYTADVTWEDGTPFASNVVLDEGVEYAFVGTFAWIRHDGGTTDNSLDNVVSYEIPAGSAEITVCTTYFDAAQPIVAEDVVKVETVQVEDKILNVVVIDVHGYEAWLLATGAVAL